MFERLVSLGKGQARTGVITTTSGIINTPAFIPVGTAATVKGVLPEMVKTLGGQAVLSNTYHLYLDPGADRVFQSGGLARYMGWSGPTFTDSGGFQVFSLGTAFGNHVSKVATGEVDSTREAKKRLATITENGVAFRSHRDGSSHFFTPEHSMEVQWKLGADIIFAFDECTSPTDSYDYQVEALGRTHRWAERSLAHHELLDATKVQSLYAVVQGGSFEDLRRKSAQYLGSLPFDGYGIGGSFTKADIQSAVHYTTCELPEEKPRHLLGIGDPVDIFLGVEVGIDTFDCVSPTRLARHGGFYTYSGVRHITNACFRSDLAPLIDGCDCYTCASGYSKGYISHLFRTKEMVGATLVSIHNLRFIVRLVDTIRSLVGTPEYERFKGHFLVEYLG